ncbi:MAG: hypothetical protein K0R14_1523 [Burkholderiales bacterium]|jgi:hypothetical protein|nr:hypothetical protein [Burkholderiales bacterium]
MKFNLQIFSIAGFIFLTITACSFWSTHDTPPTPSTLDNTVYSQNAYNTLLHSASQSLGSKLLSEGVDSDNNYTVVHGLTLKGKPIAVSILSTPSTNTYFTQQLKLPDISNTIFSNKSGIKRSPTTITRVSYKDITNPAAKGYLNSLGFNSSHNFLKRSTDFTKDNETMNLVDYIFPNQKTNSFDM